MIRWLAVLTLLWPLSAPAGGGAIAPAVAGNDIAHAQSGGSLRAVDCEPAPDVVHVHCHHATHGHLAVNTASPEDRDDSAYVARSEIYPPPAAAALVTRPHLYPRPGNSPSFILFGNFRS